MEIRRVVRFESDSGHDVEFIPSADKRGLEVWVDGIYLECLGAEDRPSEVRARYYLEVHVPEVERLVLTSCKLALQGVGS